MDATFMEKIIKRQKTGMDYLIIAGVVVAVIIVTFASLALIPQFAIFLIAGSIWGAWWLITGMNKEYEYSVTENYIDIDCIIAQRKRTRVFSGDAKEFEICARTNTDHYRDAMRGNRKILNFAPTDDANKNYFIITKNNAKKAKTKGETVLVIFEPDERMIPSIRKYSPSKIKVDGMF